MPNDMRGHEYMIRTITKFALNDSRRHSWGRFLFGLLLRMFVGLCVLLIFGHTCAFATCHPFLRDNAFEETGSRPKGLNCKRWKG
jgi:hypothetical protein